MRFALSKNKQPQQQPLRRALEIMLVGVSMGVAVVAVRTLTSAGSILQWSALSIVGLVLIIFHLWLRQDIRQAGPIKPPVIARTSRPTATELFANEDDRRWTGLADPTLPSDKREQQ